MLKGTYVFAFDLPCRNTVVRVFAIQAVLLKQKNRLTQTQIDLLKEAISGSYAIKFAFIDEKNNIKLMMQEDYDRIFPKNEQN